MIAYFEKVASEIILVYRRVFLIVKKFGRIPQLTGNNLTTFLSNFDIVWRCFCQTRG